MKCVGQHVISLETYQELKSSGDCGR